RPPTSNANDERAPTRRRVLATPKPHRRRVIRRHSHHQIRLVSQLSRLEAMSTVYTETTSPRQVPPARRYRLAQLVARFWRACRRFHADTIELQERFVLINRPWAEEFLHYAHDGQTWQLHGHRIPPDRRIRSVTSTGWCPGLHTD